MPSAACRFDNNTVITTECIVALCIVVCKALNGKQLLLIGHWLFSDQFHCTANQA